MKNTKSLLAALAVAAAATFGGCDTTQKAARNAIQLYDVQQYPQAEATLLPKIAKKDENYVLNNCRFGSCAIAAGDLQAAQNAFLSVHDVINSTNVNDSGRTAGAAVMWEGVKVWTGEPFERAMATYYLGLTFLMQGDYDNGRAAFQNSLFKLREYAKKDDPDHYRAAESNFALGYFGVGYCNLKLGKADLAKQNFDLACRINPNLTSLVQQLYRPGINTLIFIDAGRGPRRAPKGWYNEESAFGPTPAEVGPIAPVQVLVDGQDVTRGIDFSMLDSLAMAQEQRWQDIDTIRKTKAVLGTGAMAGGAGLTAYGANKHDTGLALAGVGVMALGAALAASSQADVRYWEMLPRTVYIVPAAISPAEHQIMVNTGASQGTTQLPANSVNRKGDLILYFRLPQ